MDVNRKLVRLLSTGVALHSRGINNWAFEKRQAFIVLERMKDINVPVLGGDVYVFENDILVPTYDNWSCDQLDQETNNDYALRSIDVAKAYIKNIHYNEKVPYFVLVPGDSIVEKDQVLSELKTHWHL